MGVGLGTDADRTLEAAIKASVSRSMQSSAPSALERCLRCLPPPVQADSKSPEERRSMVRRGSKWGDGGQAMPVLDKYHNRDVGEKGTLAWRRVRDADVWVALLDVRGELRTHACFLPK